MVMVSSSGSPRAFNILAVDGGGFKGLFSATLLHEIERSFGSPLHEHFDMMCGTSTGSLIVLPLSLGRPSEEIVSFYKKRGSTIFPYNKTAKMLRFLSTKSRYTSVALRNAITEILGSAKMSEAKTHVCVPSFDIVNGKTRVFKTDHHTVLNRDSDVLMRDIALASAAAPGYFPPARLNENGIDMRYVDGGIWANNPSIVGLLEACRFFCGDGCEYDEVNILSVGNVGAGVGKVASNSNPGMMEFVGDLVGWTFEAQAQSVDWLLHFIKPALRFPVNYVRIPPCQLSPQQCKEIDLDLATAKAVETLSALGKNQGATWKSRPEVAAFRRDRPTIRRSNQQEG